jgi:rod shape-determining protein MreC
MAVGFASRIRVAGCSLSLLFVALFLSAYSARNPETGQLGRLIVIEITAPVFSVVETARRGVFSLVEGYLALIDVRSDNQELRSRIEQLEAERLTTQEIRLQNERLRSLVGLVEQEKFQGVAASVVGSTPNGWVNGIVINRGSADGVLPGMAVVSAQGIVGQVVASSLHAANVLLLVDHSSGVDVFTQDGRTRGVVSGVGPRKCSLLYVRREEQVRLGDVIVTSGMDRVYPKGIMVGKIVTVEENSGSLFKEISVAPAVDFSKLEEVFVVTSSVVSGQGEPTAQKGGSKPSVALTVKERKS